MGVVLVAFTAVEAIGFERVAEPPPEPPALVIWRAPDGSWRFNRGGVFIMDQTYLALPFRDEETGNPRILGAARPVESISTGESRVDWIVLRHRFRERDRFRIRPMRPGENLPTPRSFATLLEVTGSERGRIDAGRVQGVKVGDAYALYHPAGMGRGGYLVIDQVNETTATGFLANARPSPPHDVDYAGTARKLANIAFTQGEVAFQSGRLDEARKSFELALELSGGTDERVRARLARLPDVKSSPSTSSAPVPEGGSSPSASAPAGAALDERAGALGGATPRSIPFSEDAPGARLAAP